METKPAVQNIQDTFLNNARKERKQHHDLSDEWSEADGTDSLVR